MPLDAGLSTSSARHLCIDPPTPTQVTRVSPSRARRLARIWPNSKPNLVDVGPTRSESAQIRPILGRFRRTSPGSGPDSADMGPELVPTLADSEPKFFECGPTSVEFGPKFLSTPIKVGRVPRFRATSDRFRPDMSTRSAKFGRSRPEVARVWQHTSLPSENFSAPLVPERIFEAEAAPEGDNENRLCAPRRQDHFSSKLIQGEFMSQLCSVCACTLKRGFPKQPAILKGKYGAIR